MSRQGRVHRFAQTNATITAIMVVALNSSATLASRIILAKTDSNRPTYNRSMIATAVATMMMMRMRMRVKKKLQIA